MNVHPEEKPCGSPDGSTAAAERPRCPVVGIGASAGGLDAFKRFFDSVPADSGMVFVLIQHLSPDYPSIIPELLGPHAKMPVRQLTGDTDVERNHVYVIPPNAALTIKDCVLKLSPLTEAAGHRAPIDHFFRSLAEDQEENSVAVVLSGAGSDGSRGLQAIKKHGGLTLVQEPTECRYDSMPRAAIATGMVDHVLPVEDMPSKLITFFEFRNRLLRQADGSSVQQDVLAHAGRICSVLRERLGHDLSRYKQSTLVRRIERRMQMHRLTPASKYVQMVEEDPTEVEELFKDLLIGVTQFFRDKDAFEQLARRVLPKLIAPGDGTAPVRVWVPGCATGQEAYSIAMLLHEHRGRTGATAPVQIFATDIDEEALEIARAAVYPEEIAEQAGRERLNRYFVRQEGGYRVCKEIREMCIFSMHNLVSDPPFSRMDLISCRNVLIYFEAALQQKVLAIFEYALKPEGFLFLGPAETLSTRESSFTPLDKRLRLFQAKPSRTRVAVRLPRPDGARSERIVFDSSQRIQSSRELDAQHLHERCILERYAPPSVLVDAEGEILHFIRQTSRYLEAPVGAPSHSLYDLVREPLRLPLRAALHQARSTCRPVLRGNLEVETRSEIQRLSLVVHPLTEGEVAPERFVIIFHEEGAPRLKETGADGSEEAMPDGDGAVVHQLEKELRTTREWLQSTIEELENSNEELKSSNEELISINEEYQAANESLQTSKEELQSLNEELETVNNELSKKVEELDNANADIQNLFLSTNIPTIFLNPEFRIKRFTPAATLLFRLIEGDIGRPLRDLMAEFDTRLLFEEISAVNGGAEPKDLEIETRCGRRYSARVHRYRTSDQVFEGVVVNFLDITELKTAEESLRDALVENQRMHEIGLAFSAEPDLQRLVQTITDATTEITHAQFGAFFYNTVNEQGESYMLYSLSGVPRTAFEKFPMPRNTEIFHPTFHGAGPIRSGDITKDARYGKNPPHYGMPQGHLPVVSYLAVPVISHSGEVLGGLFFGHKDPDVFTERAEAMAVSIAGLAATALDKAQLIDTLRRNAVALELSQQHFRQLADSMPQIVWTALADGRTDYFNRRWYDFTGMPEGVVEEAAWLHVLHPDDRQLCLDTWQSAVSSGRPYEIRYRFLHAATGEYRWQLGRALPVRDRAGTIVRWFGTCTDIDDLVRAEQALQDAARRKDEFLAMLGHELRNPLAPIQNGLRILDMPDTAPGTERAVKEMLQRQVRHLSRLVDDLLDVSRVSRNKILLRREVVDLAALTRAAAEDHQPALTTSQLSLHVVLPEEPVWVHGDPTRLAQAISNLVHNAGKFTEPGGEIIVLLAPSGGRAVLTIRDTGIGISPEMVEQLFEPFTQADNSLERSRGGLGLGLALVRGLIELHDGTVTGESAGLGKGSVFRLELPLTEERPAPQPAVAPADFQARRIVVIEDNHDAARTLCHLLQRRGHEVAVAHSGDAGLALVREKKAEVLVCDIGLPGQLDGYSVAQRLRLDGQHCPRLLIALTGYGQEEDQRHATEAGFDVHLTKPVDLDVLEAVIAKALTI